VSAEAASPPHAIRGKPEPEPGTEACAFCKFFIFKPDLANDVSIPQAGECHKFAPHPLGANVIPWPYVRLDDWCGEYTATPALHGPPPHEPIALKD